MTISSGGFNVNLNPTPSIYERETAGAKDMQNAADMGKGNVVIASQTDLIPFTKMDDRNKWNYKSEPERPSLMPNVLLRGAGADIREPTNWQSQYDALYDQLPDDAKLALAGLPTVYTAALKFVIDLAANVLEWQDKAVMASQMENALNRIQDNLRFPDGVYRKSLELGEELASLTEKWVGELGQNDPSYIETMEFVDAVKTLLKGTTHANG